MTDRISPPPLEWKGPIAASFRTRLLDHSQCHSCRKVIEKGDPWGAIGDCPTWGEPRIVFLRLCGDCWDLASSGMKKIRRGWEASE